jgi:hypothetical protein
VFRHFPVEILQRVDWMHLCLSQCDDWLRFVLNPIIHGHPEDALAYNAEGLDQIGQVLCRPEHCIFRFSN